MSSPVIFDFTVDDLIAEGRITREEIEQLRVKVQNVKEVPKLTDEQLALFILSCDHDIEFSVTTVKEYHQSRKNGPELFDNRNLEREELDYQLNVIEYSIFPTRTDDGCAILFHRLYDTHFTHYQMEHSMKLLFMTLDSAVYDKPPPTGLVILFDMKGVGLMHFSRVKLGALRKFCHYLQYGLPIKLQAIHVLNTLPLIDKALVILKPIVRAELLEQIQFHPPSITMEELEKVGLPKRCLPNDFNGDLPDVRTLHSRNTKRLEELRPYFDAEQAQRHDTY